MKAIKSFFRHVKRAITNPSEYRKAYAFLTTVPAELIAANVIHGSVLHWVSVVIPIVTGLLGASLGNATQPTSFTGGTSQTTVIDPSAPVPDTQSSSERIDQSPTDTTGTAAFSDLLDWLVGTLGRWRRIILNGL